ncbi:unnamed protein product [Coregonus sp. 'balchen']|nr:unnamed protein product [Coregonus sp. 'balchen']
MKRKVFRKKNLAEKAGLEYEPEIKMEEAPSPPTTPATGKRDETAIVFNKVELEQKEKNNRIKCGLTPLVGKNFKQLLGRVEACKAKLEELREKDEGKAKVQEEKMKWTNVLYKAEGLKIKDDEDLLRASFKRKEKMRSQQKKWTERSETVVEKMQRRQKHPEEQQGQSGEEGGPGQEEGLRAARASEEGSSVEGGAGVSN